METSERLVLGGVAAICPDCGDERILVEVAQSESAWSEFCCTTCDAAVLLVETLHGAPRVEERRAG